MCVNSSPPTVVPSHRQPKLWRSFRFQQLACSATTSMHPIIIVMDRLSLPNDPRVIRQKMWVPLGTIVEHSGKHFVLLQCSTWQDARFWTQGLFFALEELFIFATCNCLQAYAGLWHVQTCTGWCSDFERHISLTWCVVTCLMAASRVFCIVEPQPNTSAKQAQTLWTWCGEWQKWQVITMIILSGALTMKPASLSARPFAPCW